MNETLALAPFFWKGVAVTVAAFVLFVGCVWVLLAAVFGVRMGFLVLAVSFFGWMIILSALWTIGQPKILGVTGTLPNLGPRGTEAHWQVFAAGTGVVQSKKFPVTAKFPTAPWHAANDVEKPSVLTVSAAIQKYMVEQAEEEFARQGQDVCAATPSPGSSCLELDPTTFIVQDMEFARSNGTSLVAAHTFFNQGGPQVTVFAYRDPGNVPVYSFSFLAASIIGFLVFLPFLDRAERKRKDILTGGTAPPWYGPA